MDLVVLHLADTSQISIDDDTWIEHCVQCGTLDNAGNQLCPACDDLAA